MILPIVKAEDRDSTDVMIPTVPSDSALIIRGRQLAGREARLESMTWDTIGVHLYAAPGACGE